ncbi:GBF-interacting protein 1 [Lactuca sativa]|uniref:GBF-interacting protein 1 N-terminal domain-containing protein n=1 Tax=Lactuca sativa TaxID=4236 RepID=A0A9R1WVT4_LACSA|nr:GBF-interacting protein 1 [Lactuca sativa]KAJ0188409.1 hypothetical protein LSAT_V11C900497610 [Lactuca sativa]
MNSGVRVSIPNNVRKTIQNIKEITGNHSEDEIYAMLKECSMDPNETTQKLLLQDPFHEVRRKRDRKKENPIKESTEPRWKPGMQGRGNRGGRGSGAYSSRHNSHDAGSNRNAVSGKENEIIQGANDGVIIPATHDKKNKEKSMVSSSSNIAPDIPVSEKTTSVPDAHLSASDPILMPSQDSRIPVGTIKREWKPKPPTTNPIPVHVQVQVQDPETSDSIPVPVIPVEPVSLLTSESTIPDPKETKLEEPEPEPELESESHIPDTQHVIIPNHLHVPEAEKLGFRFGSFDFNSISLNDPVSDKCPVSNPSEGITEHIDEQDTVVTVTAADVDDHDHDPDRPSENLSTEGDMSSSVAHEPKQEPSPPGHQYPVVSFGFMPPIIGTHIAPFENTESQPSRVPSFVVQQPFDPSSYYPHFYRSAPDNDGRVSPFHPPGAPPKYNGNVAVLSSQEVGNSLMSTQVMQSSIAVTQQPLPVFRQPTGLHLPHYPPNYIPYGPYFSPFYIPPPAIHQFLSNGGFPQQGQSGNMYPGPPVATGKYPGQQYKPGGNSGNPGQGYGHFGSTQGGNSASNEDLGGPQFKESNVYVTGQQTENQGVWIATAPGRDISGSFYNLPQGGQVAYTPTQPTFASIYHHPAPPVTTTSLHPLLHQPQTMAGGVDMVGPTSNMYQQQQPPPQPTQINWPNNY